MFRLNRTSVTAFITVVAVVAPAAVARAAQAEILAVAAAARPPAAAVVANRQTVVTVEQEPRFAPGLFHFMRPRRNDLVSACPHRQTLF